MFSSILNIDQKIVTDFLLSFYNLPFAILGLYYFKRILTSLGSKENKAILITIILGLGTSFWKYTVTDFSEITQACCLLAIVFHIINKREKQWLHIFLVFCFDINKTHILNIFHPFAHFIYN